ncbi:hypothetical protein [Halomonas chromatireducens]|nr:hypothetical protein [Halomonas chromatireducens]
MQQDILPLPVYLVLLMLVWPLVLYLPVHGLMRFFQQRDQRR